MRVRVIVMFCLCALFVLPLFTSDFNQAGAQENILVAQRFHCPDLLQGGVWVCPE
jgi:hypothetical protein